MGQIGSTKLVLPKWLSYGTLIRVKRVVSMYCTRNSMNNLFSYFGLIDTKIRVSEKDLPVSATRAEGGPSMLMEHFSPVPAMLEAWQANVP